MNNKFLGMLGLAKRAGKVQTGEDICSKAVKSGVSKLIIAVSYTHLRAHETDSYLVCRLLLEKKKKQKTAAHQLCTQ